MLITAIVFFSLCIGSFLNVIVYRLPLILKQQWRNECHHFLNIPFKPTTILNLFYPRSHCPNCNHTISILENIPILSYCFLKAKCNHCKHKINIRYLLLEVVTTLISLLVVLHYGFCLQTMLALIFSWTLIVLTVIDIENQLLPDVITLPLLWLGLFCNCFGLFTNIHNSIFGAMVGYFSLWIVAKLFQLVTGKIGMANGDFKLLAALGTWTGWQLLLFIVLFASLVGSVIGISLMLFKQNRLNTSIPFGPYLALAGWIALLWGKQWLQII